MREVMYWVSMVLMWFAAGYNVFALMKLKRTERELDRQLMIWRARNEHLFDEPSGVAADENLLTNTDE